MLSKILKIFSWKNQTKQQKIDTNKDQEKVCALIFQVNKEGSINIICEWPDFDINNSSTIRDIAFNYANLINALSSGLLEKDILNTMKNCDQSNPFNNLFYRNVLVEILNIQKEQNFSYLKKLPLVSPISVFKEA